MRTSIKNIALGSVLLAASAFAQITNTAVAFNTDPETLPPDFYQIVVSPSLTPAAGNIVAVTVEFANKRLATKAVHLERNGSGHPNTLTLSMPFAYAPYKTRPVTIEVTTFSINRGTGVWQQLYTSKLNVGDVPEAPQDSN